MNRLFNTNYHHQVLDFALLLLRVGIGCFMLTHGLAKVSSAMTSPEIQFADPIGIGMETSFFLAVFAEVVCAILLIFGFLTRFAVIPLMITMAVALLVVHGADVFQKKELAAVYLLVFTFILFSGPGRYSIDRLISKKSDRRRTF